MKKLIKKNLSILFFALISMSVLTTGCSKDDNDTKPGETWTLDKITTKVTPPSGSSTTISVSAPDVTLSAKEFGMKGKLVLNEDKTYVLNLEFKKSTLLDKGTSSDKGKWEKATTGNITLTSNDKDEDPRTLIKEGTFLTTLVGTKNESTKLKLSFKKK
jgi:hypothetical protein